MSPKRYKGEKSNSEICIAVASFEVNEDVKSPKTSKNGTVRLGVNEEVKSPNTLKSETAGQKKDWRNLIAKDGKRSSENASFRQLDTQLRRKWFGCSRKKQETRRQAPHNNIQRKNYSRNWNKSRMQAPHQGDNQRLIQIAEPNSVPHHGMNLCPQMLQNTSQQHVLVNPSHDQMLTPQMEVSTTPTYILPMNWPPHYQSYNGNSNMQIAIANNPMIQQVNTVNEHSAFPDVELPLNTPMVLEAPSLKKQPTSYNHPSAESLDANTPISQQIQQFFLQRKIVSDLIQPHEQNPKVVEQSPLVGNFALFKPEYYSYVRHTKNVLNTEVLKVWYKTILLHCPWLNLPTSQKNIRRLVYWLTNTGCGCTWQSSGAVLIPVPMPEWLIEISRVVMKTTGFDSMLTTPNACNINFYRNGKDFVGWHADDHEMFGDLDGNCKILSLSLGQSRTLQFRPKDRNKHLEITSITLDHGDIITMEGLLQRYYDHRVPKSIDQTGPHINITFRWILNHNEMCPQWRRTGINPKMCMIPVNASSNFNLKTWEPSPNSGMNDLSKNINYPTLACNMRKGYTGERMQSYTDDESKMREGTITNDDWANGRAYHESSDS